MQREIARLNFEGKVNGVAEDPAVHQQTMNLGPWTATVAYGFKQFGPGGVEAPGNADPVGRALVAQLGPDEFLVTGVSARVDFRPVDTAKHRAFVKVEEGTYVDGKWKFLRIWNGDQTDYGLNFTTRPQVLRVSLMTSLKAYPCRTGSPALDGGHFVTACWASLGAFPMVARKREVNA